MDDQTRLLTEIRDLLQTLLVATEKWADESRRFQEEYRLSTQRMEEQYRLSIQGMEAEYERTQEHIRQSFDAED